jgi:hypothetical protein
MVTFSANFPCEFTFGLDSAFCEFLEVCGILPVTYLAAPPRPGFRAGSRFAITVVERGIIEVSSSNSIDDECREFPILGQESLKPTFISLIRRYQKFEIRSISKIVEGDDFPFQVED